MPRCTCGRAFERQRAHWNRKNLRIRESCLRRWNDTGNNYKFIPSTSTPLRFILLSCLLVVSINTWAQIQTNAEEAFKISSTTHKPVLLVFAGSDWCAPCMRFEKMILKESSFHTFESDNLVILKGDFPQRERLPVDVQQQNEKLAEQYNPKGQFPAFLLLRDDRTVLSTSLEYRNQSPVEFITEIKSLLQ